MIQSRIVADVTQNLRSSDSGKVRRDDVKRVDELKARALFETAAEVTGLDTAFKHYEEKREGAWC